MKGYYCSNDILTGKVNCSKEKQEETFILKDIILNEQLKGENQIWTTSWQESDPSGLYAQTVDDKKTYYFRGQPTNNYVKFANKIWRILRINEDGTIRIITEDNAIRYQTFNTNSSYKYMYYTNVKLKTVVEDWFTANITGDNVSKVASGNYFCEQAKVTYNTNHTTAGKVNLTLKEDYIPSFSCTTDLNGKGIVNSNVGLITYDELIFAGGFYYVSGLSYPFYLNINQKNAYWTMSPAGTTTGKYGIIAVWAVDETGKVTILGGNNHLEARPVINLKTNTLVTGSGTETDPYIVK